MNTGTTIKKSTLAGIALIISGLIVGPPARAPTGSRPWAEPAATKPEPQRETIIPDEALIHRFSQISFTSKQVGQPAARDQLLLEAMSIGAKLMDRGWCLDNKGWWKCSLNPLKDRMPDRRPL